MSWKRKGWVDSRGLDASEHWGKKKRVSYPGSNNNHNNICSE